MMGVDSMTDIQDLIVSELFDKKSIAALIYLIDKGRELEIKYCNTSAFISMDGSSKHCSIWIDKNEQAFDSVEELFNNAIINGKILNDVWEKTVFETLY